VDGAEKRCSGCKEVKPLSEFGLKTGGRYHRAYCKLCNAAKLRESRERLGITPALVARKQRRLLKTKEQRQSNLTRGRFVMADAKKFDGARHLNFDLSLEFVIALLQTGCAYCGDKQALLGLDRIDNNLGHTSDNVNPCCSRCNYLRRDMPFQAWKLIVPAVKAAREDGAFGDWTGGCR
jgi:hypothetical protein